MILVDTSVWIDYLRSGDAELAQQLQQNQVLMHPMVLGELALGNLKDRQLLLGLWQALPSMPIATDAQVLVEIAAQNMMGKGIGWVDAHLLTAVLLAGDVPLWTRDKRLRSLAATLNLAAPLP